MPQDVTTAVPWRIQGAVYGAGLFANSSLHLYNTIVPLWVALITRDPFIVGIALGARHFLPLLFSIHGGALMDRFGTRRVLLFLAAMSLVLPPLYPLMPWIGAVIVLQALSGYAVMTSWVGVQSLVGHAMRGHPLYTGRLTVATRIGMVAGPPLVGWCWDIGGVWAAFGLMSFWAAGTLLCAASLPVTQAQTSQLASDTAAHTPAQTPPRTNWRDLLPRWSDYIAAFSLLSIPAIATVITVTMLRHAGVTLQGTFYVYYLGEVGISGKWIGFLFSCTGIFGILGSMWVGQIARRFAARPLLLSVIAITILSVAVTPLLYASGFEIDPAFLTALLGTVGMTLDLTAIAPFLGFYFLLMVAQGLRGLSGAFAQAMEISMISQSAGAGAQGKGAALRLTAGRFSAFFLPILMGAVAKIVGLENAFYVIGGFVLAILVWLAFNAPKEKPAGAILRE